MYNMVFSMPAESHPQKITDHFDRYLIGNVPLSPLLTWVEWNQFLTSSEKLFFLTVGIRYVWCPLALKFQS